MIPRERVLTALNHKQPDQVPIDFSGHRSSGISAIAYSNLRDYLGLKKKPIRVYDLIQQLAVVDEDVLDLFHVDTIEMGRGFHLNNAEWKTWNLPNGMECEIPNYLHIEKSGNNWFLLHENGLKLGVQKEGCLYFEQIYYPLMERGIENDDFSDLEERLSENMWSAAPHPGAHIQMDENGLRDMAQKAKALRGKTDRAIIGLFGGNMFEVPQMMYRMDNYLMNIYMFPEKVAKFSEALYSIYEKNLEKWLGAVGPYIDIVLFGDDLGGQNGPLIGPETYREFYKPFHKKLWSKAKELADVKTQLHCCGGIYELLPDLIEAGIDAINPVQISSARMDSTKLKREFGSNITFWGGGCDTQFILPEANPKEIKRHVKNQLEIFSPGGGFVFQQVHNILANVPPENVVAMFEAVQEYNSN